MKINIIKICSLSLLLILATPELMAQTVMDGKVSISGLSVSKADDQLFVSMYLDVSNANIKSNRQLTLTPYLSVSGGDSIAMSPILIAGRNRYYINQRNKLFPDEKSLYRYDKADSIEYRGVIPYEKWMGNAGLFLNGETCGCCSETIEEQSWLLTMLNLEPKIFSPVFVYLKPKAEPKIRTAEGSAYVDFPVNSITLHEDYHKNRTELKKICSTIDTIKNDTDISILSVSVKGYASPEGSYTNNAWLAKNRTETLKKHIINLYDFPDTLLNTSYEPEDWAGFERSVKASDLKNRSAILDIIAKDSAPDTKEHEIKNKYPQDYALILKNIYPILRHSDYVIKYEVKEYTDVQEIKRMINTAPQKLSLQEMFLAAQETESGSDEYNEIFEIAVRMFPTDTTANLNAANTAMSKGDMKNAERYLAKAGDTPEAVYARGIFAALSNDYATAAELFEIAFTSGIQEAEKALEDIKEMNTSQPQESE